MPPVPHLDIASERHREPQNQEQREERDGHRERKGERESRDKGKMDPEQGRE